MSNNYKPTKWLGGKTIGTAQVMNNIEQGISNAHDRLDSVDLQIKSLGNNQITSSITSVKDFGAKGDGSTDDTLAFENCLSYCMRNSKTMYIPHGTYIINKQIVSSSSIDSEEALLPVSIVGEGSDVTIINTNKNIKPVMYFAKSKNVRIENIGCGNTWIQPVQYGEVFTKWNMNRTLYVQNLIAHSRKEGFHGYNLLINAPRPETYEHNNTDSHFYRYPIAIQNFSGYNAINIDNYNVDKEGNITNNADGSAIGIVERVNSSVASFLQDLTTSERPAYQIISNHDVPKSGTSNHPNFEINYNGHMAIGCSTLNNDPVARGAGSIKVRDTFPMIRFYDASNNNKEYRIQMSEGKLTLVVDGEVVFQTSDRVVSALKPLNQQLQISGNTAEKGILWKTENSNKLLYVDSDNIVRLNDYEWCTDKDGHVIQTSINGERNSRPLLRNTWSDRGFMYFDTTLNKPIWWNGTRWVDANGTTV